MAGDKSQILSDIYYRRKDLKGRFSSINTLWKIANAEKKDISKNDVRKFLKNTYTYLRTTATVPKRLRKEGRYVQLSPDYEVFIDLMHLDWGKYRWVLVAVSPTSGFTQAIRVTRKTPSVVAKALLKIRKRFPKPFQRVKSDRSVHPL